MPIGEIAQLPAEHLALLQEDVSAALDASKKAKDWIDGAIALRFADHVQALRREAGKDTGTVRFEQDGVTVVADLPKRVDWDQALITAVVERIRAAGDDPIKLHARASALLQEHSDAVLFANYRISTVKSDVGFNKKVTRALGSGERVLYTAERPAFLAKNRYGLPDMLPLDWQAFAAAMPQP